MKLTKKLLEAILSGNVHTFYISKIWRRKRKVILKRDNNECQKCKKRGGFSPATCVHHIKHLRDRPDLALVDSNLISLCDACHNEEHPEKLERFTKRTKKFINEEKW